MHPEDDALVTAMDGRRLDVRIDIERELVQLTVEGTTLVELTPSGARSLAAELRGAAGLAER